MPFRNTPNIIGIFERMLGEPVLPNAKVIGRCLFPQQEAFTTPPNQDFVFIRGTAETYTARIPFHDLTSEIGGLQIAAGSHTDGVYNYEPALGADGMGIVDPSKTLGQTVHSNKVMYSYLIVWSYIRAFPV